MTGRRKNNKNEKNYDIVGLSIMQCVLFWFTHFAVEWKFIKIAFLCAETNWNATKYREWFTKGDRSWLLRIVWFVVICKGKKMFFQICVNWKFFTFWKIRVEKRRFAKLRLFIKDKNKIFHVMSRIFIPSSPPLSDRNL